MNINEIKSNRMVKQELTAFASRKIAVFLKNGFTVTEIAKISGVERSILSRIKNCKNQKHVIASDNTLQKLYDVGIITLKEILKMDETEKKYFQKIIK
jgi:transcriptional regulator with XRE-family HTH domain